MTIKIVNKLGALPTYKTVDDMEYGDVFVIVGREAEGPYLSAGAGVVSLSDPGSFIDFDGSEPVREVNITIEVTP